MRSRGARVRPSWARGRTGRPRGGWTPAGRPAEPGLRGPRRQGVKRPSGVCQGAPAGPGRQPGTRPRRPGPRPPGGPLSPPRRWIRSLSTTPAVGRAPPAGARPAGRGRRQPAGRCHRTGRPAKRKGIERDDLGNCQAGAAGSFGRVRSAPQHGNSPPANGGWRATGRPAEPGRSSPGRRRVRGGRTQGPSDRQGR